MVTISVVLQIICRCNRLQRIIFGDWDLPGRFLYGGPVVARGDYVWHCRWSGGPSVAAILGPGGPSMATKIAIDGLGGPLVA